jgi:hypothetical protein
VEVEELKNAFSRDRSFNQPSSEPPTPAAIAESMITGHRSKQVLAENKAKIRVEQLSVATMWEQQIINMWECREELCMNYKKWCYVHPSSREHYQIRPVDMATWANKIVETDPGVGPANPPISLVTAWRNTTGNQLPVDPHTRRSKKPKKRQGRSNSGSSSSGDNSLRKL